MTTDTEALIQQIRDSATISYRRHHASARGQQACSADSYDTHLIQHAYQAGHAAAKTEASWIPEAVLPTPGMKVIATYVNDLGNRRTIMAKWVAAKTVEAFSLDDEFGEYDEATDTTYVPQGWYEIINNWDDCPLVAVHEGAITHWMPLPASPDAIRAEPKEPSDG